MSGEGKVVEARELKRNYGSRPAIDSIDFELHQGTITGLIGPNGAGKTTLLRTLLGLSPYEGFLRVLGLEPRSRRSELATRVNFMADTAILPRWMKIRHLFDYTAGVHHGFDKAMAYRLLEQTRVNPEQKVKQLSKGMIVQVHLALVLATEAELLILDEPTLGLDLHFRKRFFDQLLGEYHDENRSLLISTHQVEEIENILTHVIFLDRGRIVLHCPMEEIAERFVELRSPAGAKAPQPDTLPRPLSERKSLGTRIRIFDGVDADSLSAHGNVQTPSLSDLFIAMTNGEALHVE